MVDEVTGVREPLHGPHVELPGDLGEQGGVEQVVGSRRDQRTPQRLPGAHSRLGACRAAELHQAAHQRHLVREPVVDQRAVDLRPGGQVHRILGHLVGGAANMSCHTRSKMNGAIGAISSVTT